MYNSHVHIHKYIASSVHPSSATYVTTFNNGFTSMSVCVRRISFYRLHRNIFTCISGFMHTYACFIFLYNRCRANLRFGYHETRAMFDTFDLLIILRWSIDRWCLYFLFFFFFCCGNIFLFGIYEMEQVAEFIIIVCWYAEVTRYRSEFCRFIFDRKFAAALQILLRW